MTLPTDAVGAVVDADGHVLEPREAWRSLPERHRPMIRRDDQGYEHVVVGDTEVLAAPLGTLATPGRRFVDPRTFLSIDEALAGGSDPHARLADMDAEGIDQAMLYPSVGLYFWALADPEAAVALARAYDDWLASYCEAAPTRLFGAAMLPLQDPERAAAELRRAVGELGFKAGFARPNPCMGRTISHPAYEPVWTAAEELGVPIAIHEGSSVTIPTLGDDRPFNPLVLHAVSHAFEAMRAFAELVAFGVLQRHPRLRLVFLESSGGWAPFWLERLDEQAEAFGDFCPEMRLRPSEYFARQCAISFEVDERTLPVLAPFVGEDRIVWGSDYPHHDATFPGAVLALRRTLAGADLAFARRVLGDNARAIYGLPAVQPGAGTLANSYFGAIATKDPATLEALFAPDAELVVGATVVRGPQAIRRFYETGAFAIDDLEPRPATVRVEDGVVDVDLEVRMAGRWHRLHDRFETAAGRIRRLVIEEA
jgi:predicted TIM-barrel fold metal-dependent hydrolase